MEKLARKLRATDYFALGFGTMVGVGWLVVMDDWLTRGGPLGAALGFGLGGLALLPIGHVYGRLAAQYPDAGTEIAYAEQGFGPRAGFAAGWMMMLTYLVVCPWEAVAIGKLSAWLFPGLSVMELYRVMGKPVHLPHLALGLGLTGLLTVLNHRGIRASATFQRWATFGLLALFLTFTACGLARGSAENFSPPFGKEGALASTLLVLQIVPYFMAGFEAIPKGAEEAHLDFGARGFSRAMLLAILVGTAFYTTVCLVVGWVAPWQALTETRFATAIAFERAFGARWIVHIIIAAALLSLVKVFNGNFVAASRMLFALGRRGIVSPRLASIHATNRTPSVAVLAVGLWTAAGALLGEAILVPVTEVGSLACAVGWMSACAAYWRLRPEASQRALALVGMLVAAAMVLMKLLPFVPGHFTLPEYVALGAWLVLGVVAGSRAGKGAIATEASEATRT
jgi:amino acid transporter